MVSSIAPHVRDARRSGSCRRRQRRRAALPALAARRRAPADRRARRSPTPCRPTARRALFIIVNMQARPRFSSPISQPIAPPSSPKTIVQVGEAWMPSLCSMPMAAHVVARAVGQELRHEEERDAARAGGRIGQARQHEVDDVVGEVVLAIGDEDLLAGDAVGAVACAARRGCGSRRDRSPPAARSGSWSPSTRRRRAWRDSGSCSSSEPCAISASMAPMVSSGPSRRPWRRSSTSRRRPS